MTPQNKNWTDEILADVFELRKQGITFAEIGLKHGFTRQQATSIYHQNKHKLKPRIQSEFLDYDIHGTPFNY